MTFDSLIQFGEQLLTLAALFGVTYSAIEFIRSSRSSREAKRASLVTQWRKANIQRIISLSPDFMCANEITDALRSRSFDTPIDIRKNELTVESVRVLLIDLVKDQIVGQVWNDLYGLAQIQRDITLPMAVAGVKGNLAVRSAFGMIHEHPGRYTDQELFTKIGPDLGMSMSDFVLSMSDLDARNVARKGPDGKWSTSIAVTGNS